MAARIFIPATGDFLTEIGFNDGNRCPRCKQLLPGSGESKNRGDGHDGDNDERPAVKDEERTLFGYSFKVFQNLDKPYVVSQRCINDSIAE